VPSAVLTEDAGNARPLVKLTVAGAVPELLLKLEMEPVL